MLIYTISGPCDDGHDRCAIGQEEAVTITSRRLTDKLREIKNVNVDSSVDCYLSTQTAVSQNAVWVMFIISGLHYHIEEILDKYLRVAWHSNGGLATLNNQDRECRECRFLKKDESKRIRTEWWCTKRKLSGPRYAVDSACHKYFEPREEEQHYCGECKDLMPDGICQHETIDDHRSEQDLACCYFTLDTED
jgi:hypothetical protein